MKTIELIALTLGIWLVALPLLAESFPEETNRFTFSVRFGLNLSARFMGSPPLPALASTRRTPDGLPFNYDDGYVLKDSSGSGDGWTWNWGYDDKAAQRVGDSVVMHRSEAGTGISAPATSNDEPSFGGEVAFSRLLAVKGTFRFGVEVAANYLSFNINDNPVFTGNSIRTPYSYPFEPGTEPPPLPPGTGSHYGSSGADGFMINMTSTPGAPETVPGGTVIGLHRKFETDLWGFRLGPNLEWLLGERVRVAVSGGLAVGLLDSGACWSQTVSVANGAWSGSNSGSGHDFDILWGGYIAANVIWRLDDHWNINAGAQYQNLGRYNHSFGGQEVEMDLRNCIFLTVGLGYSF